MRWVVLLLVACGKSATPADPPAKEAPKGSAATISDAAVPDATTATAAKIPCSAVVGVVDDALGDVDAKVPEREWVLRARKRLVATACARDWKPDERKCLTSAKSAEDVAKCFEDGFIGFYETDFDIIAERAKNIAAARKRPSTLSCKHVDKALTEEEECTGPLKRSSPPGHPISEDQRQSEYEDCLKETHAGRLERCRVQRWSIDTRACLVALGPADADECFEVPQRLVEDGYALLSEKQLGDMPIECAAYAAATTGIDQCAPPPPNASKLLTDLATTVEAWRATPAAKRPALATGCKTALEAVELAAETVDCSLW
jgi:hypothetical protein